MKDHVKEERSLMLYGSVESLIEQLQNLSKDLVDAYVDNRSWGGDPDYAVVGWRPMNAAELDVARAKRKRVREANKKRREAAEAAEREQYEQLKAKYEKPETIVPNFDRP